MSAEVQVDARHYVAERYVTKERWQDYWYQVRTVLDAKPSHVLEIGVGNGIVSEVLRKFGITVDTVDIDPNLSPTHVACVTALSPVADSSYDLILCAEVLEHLPFDQFGTAVRELRRVSRRHVLISLPHAGIVFSFCFKLPLLHWIHIGFKIPFFWKTHQFNGEHYWELGKKGWPTSKIVRALKENGLRPMRVTRHADDPGHVFFICEKNPNV